jgi:hypothetical protein
MAETTVLGSENANANAVIANRDIDGLTKIAKDNIGTPASDVALRLANTIKSQTAIYNNLIAPVEKAGGVGTPQGNIAVARAFSSVADQPQWGTALLKYVLGDKQGAVKQITGGDITKKVTYDNNGDQILETQNALGEPLSYIDRKTGQPISEANYAQRVGGISSWENSLKGQTEKEIRKTSAASLVAEEDQANNWYQITQSHKPLNNEMYNNLQTLKTDIDPVLYNQIIKSVSQSLGISNSKSNSKTLLNQLNDARNRGESVTVDERISGRFGIPKGIALELRGENYVSKDNKYSINLDKLKSEQDTNSAINEATTNASQTILSIIEAERLKQLNPQAAQRLRRTIEISQQIGRELTDAVDNFKKPSFISLPTSANFVDKQAQVIAQSLQGLQNADQMEQYLQFRKQALQGHTETNTVPMPGQIGSAYVSQPLSKEIRNFYGNEINKVMSRDFTGSQRTKTNPIPVTTPQSSNLPPTAGTSAVPQAVVPPGNLGTRNIEAVNLPPLLNPTQPSSQVAAPAPAPVQAAAPAPASVQTVAPAPVQAPAPAPVAAPAPVQAAVPPPAPAPAPAPTPAPAKAPAAKAPAKAASLPKGVPAGSVDTGKYSKDGKKVYRDRSGQLHTGD